MITVAKIIPPPNCQREDETWNWNGIKIQGNSQCQGNSNQDLVLAVAKEFKIPSLSDISTFDYYALFYAYLRIIKINPTRLDAMIFTNHANFMTWLFGKNDIPVIAKAMEIPNKPVFIHEAIEQTMRPVSLGTMLSSSGHWIRVHKSNSEIESFDCNDPFGRHPYSKIQKGGFFTYSWAYLRSHVIRRIIILEDK